VSQFSENKRPGRLPEREQPPAPPDSAFDEKPFRLAKSFSLVAIVLIFASVLILAAVVSRQAEDIITKRVEDDTIKLMTNLNLQMYVNFLGPVIQRYGKVSLGNPDQREQLSGVIKVTTFGFDLKRVLIYDENAQAVFATDDSPVPAPADDRAAVTEAVDRYKAAPRLRFDMSDDNLPREVLYLPEDGLEFYPIPTALYYPDMTPRPLNRELFGRRADEAGAGRPEYQPLNPYPLFRLNPYGRAAKAGETAIPAEPAPQEGAEIFIARDDLAPEAAETAAPQAAEGAPLPSLAPARRPPDENSPARARTVRLGDEEYMKYQRSQTVFRREGGGYLLFNFLPRGEFVLRAYKVMESYGAGEGSGLSGILEVNRDLTPEYKQIALLQYFALGVAVFLSLVLTIALRWVVSRGEAVINKRNLERQTLRERLDQAERLAGLGSMVATVAHEIRNPLGIIHSTADVLDRYLARDPDQARLARAIVEEADRLSTVVTEFLDFARPPQPRPTPIVVEEILEEILAFLEITLAKNGVEVRCDFREMETPIPGDGPMLHRAFLNIIMNAVQAMDEGGLIALSTRLESSGGRDWLAVSVSDTGPGLAEDENKLFSPFYTTKAKGTGLGLVIVRNIVEGHGGRIEMTNRSASPREGDSGLTVTIRLRMDGPIETA
jgi:signal transduction histidine kinase